MTWVWLHSPIMEGGLLPLAVAKFHYADVWAYPLIVVEASAVITVLAFSSARVTVARVTTPTAAKPTVHFFNFILVPPMLLVFL